MRRARSKRIPTPLVLVYNPGQKMLKQHGVTGDADICNKTLTKDVVFRSARLQLHDIIRLRYPNTASN
jgi:hypothetical protein